MHQHEAGSAQNFLRAAPVLRAGRTPPEPHTGNGARPESKPLESHPNTLVGTRKEGLRPNTWTESGQTPALPTIVK